MKAHHHFSHCSYLGFEFARKQHTPCRSAPSNRSVPLLDYFEGTRETGDVPVGATSPLVSNRTYSTDLFQQKTLGIIRSHGIDQRVSASRRDPSAPPLFLFVSLSATHKPYLAPNGLMQRASLAHGGSYYRDCGWIEGTPTKCRSHHRKGYEAMAVGVDDLVGEMRSALTSAGMWSNSLLVFASDNGGPIGPQASNLPLRGGKDTNLEGGVRTVAAMGGGWLPLVMRGKASDTFMHESDWYATLAHVAGASAVDEDAARLGLPPVDSMNLWPSWNALLVGDDGGGANARRLDGQRKQLGMPRTLVLATRFSLPGTPFGGTSALIDVRSERQADDESGADLSGRRVVATSAYKLIRGVVCECPECRPCLHCNASDGKGGCVFDVINDPQERTDLASERPELLASLSAKLEAAIRSKFIDRDPINQECWHYPKEDPDHWLEVALKRGAVMQPWLKAPSKRGSKPRVMYPSLKRSKASAKAEQ